MMRTQYKSGKVIGQSGFSLVEMAMVLTIVGLLMAGLLPTLSSQLEQQRRAETTRHLADIEQALSGFALINGRLPCPTTEYNPGAALYGVEDASCPSPTAEGYLPWKTLGIPETDAWGSRRFNTGDAWIGYWRYRVDRNFATSFTLTTNFSTDALAIQDSNGTSLTTASERPVAIIFSTGPDTTPNGENADYESTNGLYQSDTPNTSFDDITIWLSRPRLFNRMVVAGKLP